MGTGCERKELAKTQTQGMPLRRPQTHGTDRRILQLARGAYAKIEQSLGDSVRMADLEKSLLLDSIDMLWVEHLDATEIMRRGIGLQGYGQRDPLVEYKRESFRMFNELLATIDKQVANGISVQLAREMVQQAQHEIGQGIISSGIILSGPTKEGDDPESVKATEGPLQKRRKE